MVLPAHILLPQPREVTRPGQPGPAHLPPGTIVIGRVLADPGGIPGTTPDGRTALRTQFPQGLVFVPTEDRLPVGTQLFAQVREQQGQILLGLLDGVGRGSLVRGPAVVDAPAGGQTAILFEGEVTPVDTSGRIRAGEELVAQVQPRGSRAILRALPAGLADAGGSLGVVQSADGPLLTIQVDGGDVLAAAREAIGTGARVQVRLENSPGGPRVIATVPPSADTGGGSVVEAPGPAGHREVTGVAPAENALRSLGVTSTPASRAAVAALMDVGPTAMESSAGSLAFTALDVEAAIALQAIGEPVDSVNLAAAKALLQAEVAVTRSSLEAARQLLAFGAPISPRSVSAAVALLDILTAPAPRPIELLAGALFDPPTLTADLATVRTSLMELLPQVPAEVQPAVAEIARGLAAVLLDLGSGDTAAQVSEAARFGGLRTEALLGALVERADTTGGPAVPPTGAGVDPALAQAAGEAARDIRTLLGRVQVLLRALDPDSGVTPALRTTIDEAAGRIADRVQGVQLQNLRAGVTQHLTLELPVVGAGGVEHVEVRVYYRPDEDAEGRGGRAIDERNTTIALRLDTTRLGKVNAMVAIVAGQLTADFRLETTAAADHLLGGVADLRRGLTGLGYEVARIGAVARRAAPAVERPAERLGPDGIDVRI